MSFQDKFDFDFIFPTTFDAVHHILKEFDPLRAANESSEISQVNVLHHPVHSVVFPPSVYKEKTLPDGTVVAWF